MQRHTEGTGWIGWVRLALIEGAVLAVGAAALLALVAIVDERTRALLPFIPH